MLPKDPVILLSVVNTKLRDSYKSFADLCDDLGVNSAEIAEKLALIDYFYDEGQNQFV